MFDMLGVRSTEVVGNPIMIHSRQAVWAGLVFAASGALLPPTGAAASLDGLMDLTGQAIPIVTLKARDTFTSEYRYEVTVRNVSPDPLQAESLVVVLDKVTNLAGDERGIFKTESNLQRMEVLGQDGETDDGKPFFHIPAGDSLDLLPQTDSRAVSIRLRNKDYIAVFTPAFRVFGLKRSRPEPKHAEVPQPQAPPSPPTKTSVDKLIQLLIKKGVLTEEEWRKANQP